MKKKSSKFPCFIIFLIVSALLAVGYYYFIWKDKPVSPPPTTPPQRSQTLPRTTKDKPVDTPTPSPSLTPTPAPKTPKKTPLVSLETAISNIARAKKMLAEGKVKEAKKLLEEALKAELPEKARIGAEKLLQNTLTLEKLLVDLEVSPSITGDKLVTITLKNGSVLQGIILEEKPDSIKLQTSGGIKITLRKAEIQKTVPLKVEKFQDSKRALLEKLIRTAERNKEGSWIPWFKAFKFAREFDLTPEVFDLYLIIVERYPDFSQKLAEYEAYKLYRIAMSYFSRGMVLLAKKTANELIEKYPESQYCQSASELVDIIMGRPIASLDSSDEKPVASNGSSGETPKATPKPQATKKPATSQAPPKSDDEVKRENRVLDPPKATNEQLKEANSLYLKAKKQINKAFEHLGEDEYEDAVKCFNEALELLHKAAEIYEIQLEINPSSYLEAFIEQVYKLIYLANKSKPLGVMR